MCCVLVLLTSINCYSVSWTNKVQYIFTIAKVSALMIIIVIGFIQLARGLCLFSYSVLTCVPVVTSNVSDRKAYLQTRFANMCANTRWQEGILRADYKYCSSYCQRFLVSVEYLWRTGVNLNLESMTKQAVSVVTGNTICPRPSSPSVGAEVPYATEPTAT